MLDAKFVYRLMMALSASMCCEVAFVANSTALLGFPLRPPELPHNRLSSHDLVHLPV